MSASDAPDGPGPSGVVVLRTATAEAVRQRRSLWRRGPDTVETSPSGAVHAFEIGDAFTLCGLDIRDLHLFLDLTFGRDTEAVDRCELCGATAVADPRYS